MLCMLAINRAKLILSFNPHDSSSWVSWGIGLASSPSLSPALKKMESKSAGGGLGMGRPFVNKLGSRVTHMQN